MTIETKKPKSLEEALADLRRPEVRTSLETYVPVSFAAMRDVDGGGDELLADAAHFTLDLKYMGKLADRELAFLHEIIDVKTGVKTETGEQKETLYQKGKRFILEGGFNAEDYALFVADLWFKYYCKCETKDGISWISTKTGEQVLARIMCAITDPQYVPFGSDEDKRVYAQKGATGVPIVKNPLWEYVDAIREYKQGHGLESDALPVDVSVLRNATMKYGDCLGPCASIYGLNRFYERFYSEAVQEIPGLKEKVVAIGRKYGVEMKTE